jgi:DNA-binding MltR family transcriptional regulator
MNSPQDDQFSEVMSFRKSLDAETDRGCGLMAAAFLDTELDRLLRSVLVEDDKVANELLDQSKPVGTFSSRIDLCYLLGLISPLSRRDFHLVRKIRNAFGHTHLPIGFGGKGTANRCRELTHHLRDGSDPPRKLFVSSAVGLLAVIHSAMNESERIAARKDPNLDRAKFEADRMMKEQLAGKRDDT